MAKICFLTFYDEICIGPRMLSSVLKNRGHEANIIIFKGERYDEVIDEDRDDLKCYAYYREGILRGSLFDIDPWTEADEANLVGLIRKLSPDALAISTRSFWADLGKRLTSRIREEFPGLKFIAGGWGPSLEPEKFLDYCDLVFFGEGVRVIEDIADALDRGSSLRDIRNAIYMKDGKLIKNDVYHPVDDLDSLPYPDFGTEGKYLVNDGTVKEAVEFYNPKMYDVYACQGCPFTCSYCMSSKWHKVYKDEFGIQTKVTRTRSVKHLMGEIRAAKERGAVFIRIKDEVFPSRTEWINEFIDLYRREIGLPFSAYLRPEFHDGETIRRLREAGLVTTTVGIQSGSQYVLKNIYHRHTGLERVREFAQTVSGLGINFEYHMIGFCPAEREEHMRESLDFLFTLPYGMMKVFKIKYFPKAPITVMLGDGRQSKEKNTLDEWYTRLYTMATKGGEWRELARVIHRNSMFRETPRVLQSLFIPELEKEKRKLDERKRTMNARSFSIPESMITKSAGSGACPSGDLVPSGR